MRTRKRQWLKPFEREVLKAVSELQNDDCYAVTIRRLLENNTGRRYKFGTIYTALAWLETKGCVSARMSPGGPERNFHAKRNYQLKPPGEKSLREPDWNPNPESLSFVDVILLQSPYLVLIVSIAGMVLGKPLVVLISIAVSLVMLEIGKRRWPRSDRD